MEAILTLCLLTAPGNIIGGVLIWAVSKKAYERKVISVRKVGENYNADNRS